MRGLCRVRGVCGGAGGVGCMGLFEAGLGDGDAGYVKDSAGEGVYEFF